MNFADAMVELVRATDARGLPVHLYRGDWTADSLRHTTREFWRRAGFNADRVEFLSLNLTDSLDPVEQRRLEANAWENLAKLATATAAAIREGR